MYGFSLWNPPYPLYQGGNLYFLASRRSRGGEIHSPLPPKAEGGRKEGVFILLVQVSLPLAALAKVMRSEPTRENI